MSDSHGAQMEAELRQLAARDLRRVMIGPPLKIFERVEPEHTAGSGPGSAPRSLRSRSLADAPDLERRQAGPGRVTRDTRQAAVDHGRHTFDGDGAFRHV